jgi:F-type H+-transporting ATPase subunit a
MASPIAQFEIVPLLPLSVAGVDISFTNSALMMVVGLAVATLVLGIGSAQRQLVPGRLQAACEGLYDFIAKMIDDNIGHGGRHYFPFIFTLFLVVFLGNSLGLIPYAFTYTSHLIVTAALGMMVFFCVLAFGFARHGLHFLSVFLPPGIPLWLTPLILAIEVISFFIRPITLAVRLFANMMAGHVMLKVFAGFCVTFISLGGVLGAAAIIPLLFNGVLIGFEFLIAFLQAYVFAVLSCIYLKDTVELEH